MQHMACRGSLRAPRAERARGVGEGGSVACDGSEIAAPVEAPRELMAEVTAAAAEAPVLPAALLAALVPARGPATMHWHGHRKGARSAQQQSACLFCCNKHLLHI